MKIRDFWMYVNTGTLVQTRYMCAHQKRNTQEGRRCSAFGWIEKEKSETNDWLIFPIRRKIWVLESGRPEHPFRWWSPGSSGIESWCVPPAHWSCLLDRSNSTLSRQERRRPCTKCLCRSELGDPSTRDADCQNHRSETASLWIRAPYRHASVRAARHTLPFGFRKTHTARHHREKCACPPTEKREMSFNEWMKHCIYYMLLFYDLYIWAF